MPTSDTWLQISLRAPVLVAVAILLVLVAGVGYFSVTYLRQKKTIKALLARQNGAGMPMVAPDQDHREAYLQFIYNLSHEVSNPLQSIQTILDNMSQLTPAEVGRWQQSHTIIAAEIRRLSGLTNNLRTLSRLETPGRPVLREPINLKGIIESVMMTQIEIAEGRGIRLIYDGPERLARVLGNRDDLQQALLNLVDNGIKYAKEGGGEIIIKVHEQNDRLIVRVIDSGIGIADEDLPYIFDTAYRAPSTGSFKRAGSGLGLAIVRLIVEQHGGKITAHSRLGEGTTISFDLPAYFPS
jgi:signal transduction histidine kinase